MKLIENRGKLLKKGNIAHAAESDREIRRSARRDPNMGEMDAGSHTVSAQTTWTGTPLVAGRTCG